MKAIVILLVLALTGTVWSAQPEPGVIQLHGKSTYTAGLHVIGPFAVPLSMTQARFSYDTVNHTNPLICWRLFIRWSQDGGTTWTPIQTTEPYLGTMGHRCGGPGARGATTAGWTIKIPGDPNNPGRRAELTLSITGGSFTTNGGVLILQ